MWNYRSVLQKHAKHPLCAQPRAGAVVGPPPTPAQAASLGPASLGTSGSPLRGTPAPHGAQPRAGMQRCQGPRKRLISPRVRKRTWPSGSAAAAHLRPALTQLQPV